MKYSIFESPRTDIDAIAHTAEAASASWVRFGSEVLVYSANDKWTTVEKQVSSRAVRHDTSVGTVNKSRMHLVVQKGRVFQNEFPNVRVILDKGRYLVVDLDPPTARTLTVRKAPCFHIERLRANSVIFDVLAPPERRSPDMRVSTVVDALDVERYRSTLSQLASFSTRYSTSLHYAEVARWAADQFNELGFATELQPVSLPGTGESLNVIATKLGIGINPRGRLLIVGHLDSINQAGGPGAPAPGADDNASGSAGVLEIAAVMASCEFEHDLTFILFGGEEQGLHGSIQYVSGLTDGEHSRIRAVINMDMIGSVNTLPPSVLLEGSTISQAEIDDLAGVAGTYTTLSVQTSLNPFASDHVPFIQAGIPAVLTIEGTDSANESIHTASDTLDKVDAAFAFQILKMNTAFAAQRAEIRPETHSDCGCGPVKGAPAPDAKIARRHLINHYQHLLAQYTRLHKEERLQPQDYDDWQTIRRTLATLIDDTAESRAPAQ